MLDSVVALSCTIVTLSGTFIRMRWRFHLKFCYLLAHIESRSRGRTRIGVLKWTETHNSFLGIRSRWIAALLPKISCSKFYRWWFIVIMYVYAKTLIFTNVVIILWCLDVCWLLMLNRFHASGLKVSSGLVILLLISEISNVFSRTPRRLTSELCSRDGASRDWLFGDFDGDGVSDAICFANAAV